MTHRHASRSRRPSATWCSSASSTRRDALVWKCWTDPEHLAAWWGPDGFTNEVDLDLRPGGHQNITMIGPGRRALPGQRRAILEVVEGEKLVER